MYGKTSIQSKQELYKHISDEQIYLHYFGEFEPGQYYLSPFREEKDGSFRIDYFNDEWLWRDFGVDFRPKDPISFIQQKFGINFYQALNKIYNEVVEGKKDFTYQKKLKRVSTQEPSTASVRIFTEYQKFEEQYWMQGNISKKQLLETYKVFPCEVWYKGGRLHKSTSGDPYFAFVFDKIKKIWKAYRPYSNNPKFKFFSNNVNNHIQGWDLMIKKYLGKTDILFIMGGAYKDVIIMDQLDYAAIAPHTECMFLAPWEIDYLKQHFKHIYVFYDNDSTGIKKCMEFTELYSLNYINIPHGLNTKEKVTTDPWDVVVNYDYQLLNEIIYDKFIRDGI